MLSYIFLPSQKATLLLIPYLFTIPLSSKNSIFIKILLFYFSLLFLFLDFPTVFFFLKLPQPLAQTTNHKHRHKHKQTQTHADKKKSSSEPIWNPNMTGANHDHDPNTPIHDHDPTTPIHNPQPTTTPIHNPQPTTTPIHNQQPRRSTTTPTHNSQPTTDPQRDLEMGLIWDAVWSFGNGEGSWRGWGWIGKGIWRWVWDETPCEASAMERMKVNRLRFSNGGWCVMLMLMLGGVWVWREDRADGDTENKEREGNWSARQSRE